MNRVISFEHQINRHGKKIIMCIKLLIPQWNIIILVQQKLCIILWFSNSLILFIAISKENVYFMLNVCVFVKEGKCECVWSTVKHSLDWRTHGVSISFKAGQNLFEFIIFPNKNCSNSLFFQTKFVRIYHFFEQNLEQIIFLNFFWKYSPPPNKQFLKQ